MKLEGWHSPSASQLAHACSAHVKSLGNRTVHRTHVQLAHPGGAKRPWGAGPQGFLLEGTTGSATAANMRCALLPAPSILKSTLPALLPFLLNCSIASLSLSAARPGPSSDLKLPSQTHMLQQGPAGLQASHASR